MTHYLVADKEDMELVLKLCKAHEKAIVTVDEIVRRDEYILSITTSLIDWLRLRRVLPLGKPVLLHRIEF